MVAVELTAGKKKAETVATMTKLNMKAPNRLFLLLYLNNMRRLFGQLSALSQGTNQGKKIRSPSR